MSNHKIKFVLECSTNYNRLKDPSDQARVSTTARVQVMIKTPGFHGHGRGFGRVATTYRCAVAAELPLTTPEQSHLSDADLIAAALAESSAVGLTMDDGARPVVESDIRITTWTR
jgi:methylmalonyl-CoA mutase cobalamin-binding subunit